MQSQLSLVNWELSEKKKAVKLGMCTNTLFSNRSGIETGPEGTGSYMK